MERSGSEFNKKKGNNHKRNKVGQPNQTDQCVKCSLNVHFFLVQLHRSVRIFNV